MTADIKGVRQFMVKVEDLEKKIKTEELTGMYLFYGEETYLLETMVKKIKKSFRRISTRY